MIKTEDLKLFTECHLKRKVVFPNILNVLKMLHATKLKSSLRFLLCKHTYFLHFCRSIASYALVHKNEDCIWCRERTGLPS